MLDIGFAELLVVSAVALFVVGPERLPSAIRAISLWLGKVRRGFEEIKADVSRELHNEEVMRALRESRDEVQDLTDVSSALSLDPVALDPVDQEKSGAHEPDTDEKASSAIDASAKETASSPSDSPIDSENPAQ
ncbi:MAG: Sec-independent protein translocase protein TatB [Halieaceae bacterium]|jgi:sec-independent protein translocase protein TatB